MKMVVIIQAMAVFVFVYKVAYKVLFFLICVGVITVLMDLLTPGNM